jgi:CRISPR-associated endoribonuclease Cas6
MRIQFSLACQRGTVIPINYQAEVSNWMFDVFAKANTELSIWIQHQGFDVKARTFRQFTFSPLAIYPYEMDQTRQEFKLLGNQVKIGVSVFLPHQFEQSVIQLFRQTPLILGLLDGQPAQFDVRHWQILPRPHFKEVAQFRAIAPISVTNVDDELQLPNPFIVPELEAYDISFFTHIVRRYKAAYQYKSLNSLKLLDASFPMSYRLLGQSKSRLIHLELLRLNAGFNQLRGFVYDFEVSMPLPVMEYCYYAGFGEHPYLGFGYVDFREDDQAPGKGPRMRPSEQKPRRHHDGPRG